MGIIIKASPFAHLTLSCLDFPLLFLPLTHTNTHKIHLMCREMDQNCRDRGKARLLISKDFSWSSSFLVTLSSFLIVFIPLFFLSSINLFINLPLSHFPYSFCCGGLCAFLFIIKSFFIITSPSHFEKFTPITLSFKANHPFLPTRGVIAATRRTFFLSKLPSLSGE